MPASLHPIFIMRRLTLHCLLIMAAAASSEIFNLRIVLDSLIFISMAAARWPGPRGMLQCATASLWHTASLPVPVKSERVRECDCE